MTSLENWLTADRTEMALCEGGSKCSDQCPSEKRSSHAETQRKAAVKTAQRDQPRNRERGPWAGARREARKTSSLELFEVHHNLTPDLQGHRFLLVEAIQSVQSKLM